MSLKNISIFMILILFSPVAFASETVLATNISQEGGLRADDHAPISVMGDHLHDKGEWMLSYRYRQMRMSGNQVGHHGISNAGVLQDYMVTPTEMTMQMHMFGFMYAPSDDVTLMMMLPFGRKDMSHRMRTGVTFDTHSEGLGDLKITGLVSLLKTEHHKVHLNAGLSAPIGETDEHADLPTGPNQRMPYSMQMGSGTWDLLPGLTYNGQKEDLSWGLQGLATIRPGRNRIGYALGNQYEVTTWAAYSWADFISSSLGFKYSIWQNITGRDASLNPSMVPTADPNSRGGKRIDLLAGVNFVVPKGVLKGNRLAIDFGFPIMQSLDGPQLETDWYFTTGWQLAF